MAISKNKNKIIDKIISNDLKEGINWFNNYLQDYDDDCYSEFDYDYYFKSDYEYLGDLTLEYVSKRVLVTKTKYTHGEYIDMTSVYTKSRLRQMRLDAILEGKRLPNEKNYLTDIISKESLDNLNKIKNEKK